VNSGTNWLEFQELEELNRPGEESLPRTEIKFKTIHVILASRLLIFVLAFR
jgi:hypothetical protein